MVWALMIAAACGVSVSRAEEVVRAGIDARPQVPCEKDAKIIFGEVDKAPLIKAWSEAEMGKDWAPPA